MPLVCMLKAIVWPTWLSDFVTLRRWVFSVPAPLEMSVVRPYPTLSTLVPTARPSDAEASGIVGVVASTPAMRSTAKSYGPPTCPV